MSSLLRYCFDLYPPILCPAVCLPLPHFGEDLWPLPSWRQQGEISSWLPSAISQPVTCLFCFQSLTCADSYAAPDLYSRKKNLILWLCLISATKRLLEVSLCWDAYKKVWAWSSKLICCQIELNNFLLLSCLAASSLGGGFLAYSLHCKICEAVTVSFCVMDCSSVKPWAVSLTRLHPSLSLSHALRGNCPDLGSTAEIFSPRCSFLSNPWTI